MFKICEIACREDIDRLHQQELEKKVSSLTPQNLCNSSSASSFRDVHVYDSNSERINIPVYSDDERKMYIQYLRLLIRNPSANAMLGIILNRDNTDPLNSVNSSDLLVWICQNYITTDLFYLLEEQLADNNMLGTCLQGSSHRIRQIYYAQLEI